MVTKLMKMGANIRPMATNLEFNSSILPISLRFFLPINFFSPVTKFINQSVLTTNMDEKGQGSFEYILLVAGVLSVVAIAYYMMRSGPVQGGKDMVNKSYLDYQNATNTSGYI